MRADDAVDIFDVRAKLLVGAVMSALRQKMQVVVTQ